MVVEVDCDAQQDFYTKYDALFENILSATEVTTKDSGEHSYISQYWEFDTFARLIYYCNSGLPMEAVEYKYYPDTTICSRWIYNSHNGLHDSALLIEKYTPKGGIFGVSLSNYDSSTSIYNIRGYILKEVYYNHGNVCLTVNYKYDNHLIKTISYITRSGHEFKRRDFTYKLKPDN